MDLTRMEKVEQANGRALPDECHGLIADYVGEKVQPQWRMQKKLDAIRSLYERFEHLDLVFRLIGDDEESDVVHRIAQELWIGLSDCASRT